MAAFVFLGTQLRIPTSIGYMNLGDAVILTASYIMGPAAFFPAAIGSALSDLIAGYPMYIIPTFVIKGLMGLVAGLIMRHPEHSPRPSYKKITAGVIAELIMVSGYFALRSLFTVTHPRSRGSFQSYTGRQRHSSLRSRVRICLKMLRYDALILPLCLILRFNACIIISTVIFKTNKEANK